MAVLPQYFARLSGAGEFSPLDDMRSAWASDRVPGPAVAGLLALGAVDAARELAPGASLIRVTTELHSVVRVAPVTLAHSVLKAGRRLTLLLVTLRQAGHEVARAHAAFAAPQPAPGNDLWLPDLTVSPPPPGSESDALGRQYYSALSGWVSRGAEVAAVSQKGVWIEGVELVAGERTPPEALAGLLADAVNPAGSWGSGGIHHINVDATLHLSRRPESGGVGLLAERVVEGAGVLATSAVVFDRAGALGVATATSIAQRSAVDPARWAPG
ncbi:acyl-CoA thioesterase domain-containing protein [Leucobacter albus]|uniref:Acyl-CoA thioesterase domain-containing protein n=1 Tax=Leucobacter albus TaxID=272210 RepID=A0ABW3TMF2_9MICO